MRPLRFAVFCFSLIIVSLAFTCLSQAKIDPKTIVGIWLLDGQGKKVDDTSGNKNHGEVSGTAKWVKGKFGDGLELDGSTVVEIPDAKSLRLGQKQTVVAWVYATARVADWARIVGKGKSGPRNYGLWTSASGHLLYQVYGSQTCNAYNAAFNDDDSFVPTGKWTHIAGTYDGEKIKIFTNGSEVVKFTSACSTVPPESEDPLVFGKMPDLHTSFKGIIDEVCILSSALSEGDITNLMNRGITQTLSITPKGSLTSTWGKIKE